MVQNEWPPIVFLFLAFARSWPAQKSLTPLEITPNAQFPLTQTFIKGKGMMRVIETIYNF
ncbi:hypothetical protein [Caldithrix abyssi]|uniref:hypothetical protein n=1 Tax=Caldithrix abyssi TaxID=187145 RepID=UPI0009042FB6|nr:hypothetical protein [Caldithrix abyssi]